MATYVHGTEPSEQARLSTLNDLLNAACLDALAPAPGEGAADGAIWYGICWAEAIR